MWAAAIRSHGKIIGMQTAITETLQAADEQLTSGVDKVCLSAASWSLVWEYCEQINEDHKGNWY